MREITTAAALGGDAPQVPFTSIGTDNRFATGPNCSRSGGLSANRQQHSRKVNKRPPCHLVTHGEFQAHEPTVPECLFSVTFALRA